MKEVGDKTLVRVSSGAAGKEAFQGVDVVWLADLEVEEVGVSVKKIGDNGVVEDMVGRGGEEADVGESLEGSGERRIVVRVGEEAGYARMFL